MSEASLSNHTIIIYLNNRSFTSVYPIAVLNDLLVNSFKWSYKLWAHFHMNQLWHVGLEHTIQRPLSIALI